jgi:hypothetical protein
MTTSPKGLIVSAGKLAKPEKVGGQRRQIAQDLLGRLELVDRPVAVGSHLDDDAQPFAPAERHPDAQADIGRRRRLGDVVEQAVQRQIEGDAQDGHIFSDRSRHFSEKQACSSHDRRLLKLSTKTVDNFVNYFRANTLSNGRVRVLSRCRNNGQNTKPF